MIFKSFKTYFKPLVLVMALQPFPSMVLLAATADEWPMFKNDLGHTSVNASDSLQAPFSLLWSSSSVIGATNSVAYSSPVMWNGKTYIGGVDGTLYAFAGAVTTSANPPLWSFKTTGLIYGSAAVTSLVSGGVTNDYVYVGATDGNLYCLDSMTSPGNTFVWTAPLGGAIFTSPLIVPEASGTLVICASHSGILNAYNALTGAAAWTAPATITTNFLFSSPAYDATNDQVLEPS